MTVSEITVNDCGKDSRDCFIVTEESAFNEIQILKDSITPAAIRDISQENQTQMGHNGSSSTSIDYRVIQCSNETSQKVSTPPSHEDCGATGQEGGVSPTQEGCVATLQEGGVATSLEGSVASTQKGGVVSDEGGDKGNVY